MMRVDQCRGSCPPYVPFVIPSPNDLRGLQDIIQLCHLSDTAALTAISLLPVLVHLVGTPVILVNLETEFTDTQHDLSEC
jgi:hypothetical protein